MSGSLSVVSHLKGVIELPHTDDTTAYLDLDQILPLASVYALFGHKVHLREAHSGREFTPSVTSRECIVEPLSITFDPNKHPDYQIMYSEADDLKHQVLPNVLNMMTTPGSRAIFQKPCIVATVWQKKHVPLRPYIQLTKRAQPVEFKVVAPYSYATTSFQAREFKKQDIRQDFTIDMSVVPPAKPEGQKIPITERWDPPVHTESPIGPVEPAG